MATNKILLSVVLAAAATSAHADVTVNTITSGKASFIDVGGTGVISIKGTRQRSDQTVGGKNQALIIDIDGRRFVNIDDKKKSATVTPLDSIADELQKVGIGTINATLTKTAQTKTIAGFPCTVHDIKLSLPFSPTGQTGQGMDLNMLLTGTVCLSTSAPGSRTTRSSTRQPPIRASSSVIRAPQSRPPARPRPRPMPRSRARWPRQAWRSKARSTSTPAGDNPMAGMFAKLAKSHIIYHRHRRHRGRCGS